MERGRKRSNAEEVGAYLPRYWLYTGSSATACQELVCASSKEALVSGAVLHSPQLNILRQNTWAVREAAADKVLSL